MGRSIPQVGVCGRVQQATTRLHDDGPSMPCRYPYQEPRQLASFAVIGRQPPTRSADARNESLTVPDRYCPGMFKRLKLRREREAARLVWFSATTMSRPDGGGGFVSRRSLITARSDDPWRSARRYDSELVREWEGVVAARADIGFALSCCVELLHNRDALTDGGTPALQRALWDALLVAVFKHYRGPSATVHRIFDEVVSGEGQEVEGAFRDWGLERDRRVAHSVGFREEHRIVTWLTQSGDIDHVSSASHGVFRPAAEGVRWVRAVFYRIWQQLDSEERRLMAAVENELSQLAPEVLARLPMYRSNPMGQGRPPGS